MDLNKGKPMTTSVPSIAIRFNANAEEIEELYGDDKEQSTANDVGGEPESSPLKGYLPKLIKRSASIDTSPASTTQDSSPPSDPWRFFTDIKGKIEEKLTEIKARKEEENNSSPRKLQTGIVKDDSAASDSEDQSESSISKTCGVVSTTEGVEMSSDEDTTSLEKDMSKKEKRTNKGISCPSSLRRRFKFFKHKSTPREGVISSAGLRDICSIASGTERPLASDFVGDIESGIDVLEEANFEGPQTVGQSGTTTDENEVLKELSEQIDNIEVDQEQVLNVKELSGAETVDKFNEHKESVTVFAPAGFVDMRNYVETTPPDHSTYRYLMAFALFLAFYYIVHDYCAYLAGMLAGVGVTLTITIIYNKLFSVSTADSFRSEASSAVSQQSLLHHQQQILEVPAVKEYQPLAKYEGWMNEYPDVYDPLGYHISQTQPVFVRLQGHLLRLSHTKAKIPKRAMWNEPKIKANLTYHRIYNLLGAKVSLLPVGLTRKRFWSKKYPICITLSKEQMNFDCYSANTKSVVDNKSRKDFHLEEGEKKKKRKSNISLLPQRFSKLTEEEEDLDLDSESRASTPSPDSSPDENHKESNGFDAVLKDVLENDEQLDEDLFSLPDDWSFNTNDESPSETKIYLFGRCDREKEDWFRRFVKATHKGVVQTICSEDNELETQESISETLLEDHALEMQYTKYMSKYTQVHQQLSLVHLFQYPKLHKLKKKRNQTESEMEHDNIPNLEMLWVNAMIGRIIFDCVRNESFTQRIKERIQRKLSSIKLPYFIDELNLTELSLGSTSPFLHNAGAPVIDQRGLWVDIDMTYEGLVVLILQTNLNLMKLKQQRTEGKPTQDRPLAMYHSDVDDTAESSSNDESTFFSSVPGVSFDTATGGTSNTSKKVLKMVDKIAESKFFQAATDNKYIKNLMEGVSNTDLRLKVEVRSLSGKLVLNIPPPPSDRIFVGFRPVPKLLLSAQPIVGERNITMMRIINWIEKKLLLEFQKVMVMPNMEDFVIPVMCQKLPG